MRHFCPIFATLQSLPQRPISAVARVIQNKGSKTFVRRLNLLEYQSKNLLSQNGIKVQRFCMAEHAGEIKDIKNNLNVDEYVIKAQILAGGRGLGHFSNGFKGGVQVTKSPEEVASLVGKMVGHRLITKQTPKDGILVRKVMIAESVNIKRETYFCLLMDRNHNGPVLIASPAGGMDIEEVAEKTPHLLLTKPIDIVQGLTMADALEVADFLKFTNDLRQKAADQVIRMWKFFLKVDATQLEINPLAETSSPSDVIAVDAKIGFDDNAKYRQKDIFDLEDNSESDPREVDAAGHNLNYIGMNGNIGCLVNGAGLAMATMDIIKLYGGEPANFLDVGGGVQENQVFHAFRILTSDKSVKSILVNVFGGIVNCAVIARGIISASKEVKLNIPLVVRLEGTNVDEAKRILKESGLTIESASNLDEAAKKAVSSLGS